MKSTNRIVTALAFTLASVGAQAATLDVGDNLMIESINGQAITDKAQNLGTGEHLVEVRFSDRYYTNARDSGNWVRSAPLFATISLTKGETIKLVTPDIGDEQQAREFVRQPELQLTSSQGRSEQVEFKTQAQMMSQLLAGM